MSENLLAYVHPGSAVDLVIPSLNDTVIKAFITYKGNFIDPVNRTFRIQIDLKNNTLLLPNQLAKVSVTDFTKKNALVVHSESILQDTQNNTYVYKLNKEKDNRYTVTKLFVSIQKRHGEESCIVPIIENSLKQGDQIVLLGAKGITENDIVKLQD